MGFDQALLLFVRHLLDRMDFFAPMQGFFLARHTRCKHLLVIPAVGCIAGFGLGQALAFCLTLAFSRNPNLSLFQILLMSLRMPLLQALYLTELLSRFLLLPLFRLVIWLENLYRLGTRVRCTRQPGRDTGIGFRNPRTVGFLLRRT